MLTLASDLLLKSRILGLVWRATIYFVQNDTVLIPPGDRRRRVSGRTQTTHFGVKLKTQNVSYFSCLKSD